MSIKQYTEAQLKEMAMLEVAYEVLSESNNPFDYHALLKQVAEVKELTEEQLTTRIANLYTEMSMDGRFVNIGENRWGLRSWYPFDQTEEELSQANKTRKKRRDDDEEDDFYDDEEVDDFDEFEDLEDELDELANEEDEDFEEDDDDEDLDEDEDEFEDEFEGEDNEDELL